MSDVDRMWHLKELLRLAPQFLLDSLFLREETPVGLTIDRHDGCLHEIDPETGMQKCYLVKPSGERKNLVAPVRRAYRHVLCGHTTTMAQEIAETYAAEPTFYGGTYCANCRTHFSFNNEENGDFRWLDDNTRVGSLPEPQKV